MGTKKTDSETDNKVENYSKTLGFANLNLLKKSLDSKNLGTLWNPLNWDLREFICGWGSAFINICVTYPINKVTFRQVSFNFLNYFL